MGERESGRGREGWSQFFLSASGKIMFAIGHAIGHGDGHGVGDVIGDVIGDVLGHGWVRDCACGWGCDCD